MGIYHILTDREEDDHYVEATSKREARSRAKEFIRNKYKGVFYKSGKKLRTDLGEIQFEIIEIIKLKIINRP